MFVAIEELNLTVDELQVALSIELVHAVLPKLGLVDRVPSIVVLFNLLFPLFEAGELLVVLIEFDEQLVNDFLDVFVNPHAVLELLDCGVGIDHCQVVHALLVKHQLLQKMLYPKSLP